ncbi:hypothetical protein NQP46_29560 [Streptomyces albus]|nr:hypothetical protein NQP46_29560 [Streptomyces albus]
MALSESSGLTVVGLRDGAVLSRNSLPSSPTRGTGHPWVVESGGSIYYVHRDESKIGYVPLSPGDWFIEVGQQALTRDGRHMITVLADGSRVQVHPTRGTAGKVLADVPRRKPYWVPESGDQLTLDRTGRLVAAREGAGIVTVREVPTLRAAPPRSSPPDLRGRPRTRAAPPGRRTTSRTSSMVGENWSPSPEPSSSSGTPARADGWRASMPRWSVREPGAPRTRSCGSALSRRRRTGSASSSWTGPASTSSTSPPDGPSKR